ncbi:hypothetical protein ACLE2W_11760 [Pseudomonas shahriarae]|uniref:hypothetical protein n=1 Tax=Pseudomonas shahriarae TaxID=2745512 RepID=UPI002076BCE9|nr:hypothetical protein [Pseudomonas shahriarae]MCM8560794.1 hypothetical protein [Pseudomonas shahriarae]
MQDTLPNVHACLIDISSVVSTRRPKGVGVAVLRVIEAIAAEQGIARFHLLTTTAPGFFDQQG